MVKSEAVELVFIPSPAVGHLFSTLEIAKLLVNRDPNLSITVLTIKFPNIDSSITSDSTRHQLNRIQFIDLPIPQSSESDLKDYVNSQKPHVKEAVTTRFARPDSPQLAGFVLDMFCAPMIDVADELGVPTYIFMTSGAAFLGLLFHAQYLNDELGKPAYEMDKDSDTDLVVPSFQNTYPVKYLPSVFFSKEWFGILCEMARRVRGAKGIIVNTFNGLESYAVNSFTGDYPPLYPVGPILNLKGKKEDDEKKLEIMGWLDGQPDSSVVFLCFGSVGSFGVEQVKEIANGLERSGHRFLWSLRKPTSRIKNRVEIPGDYDDFTNVLPEGFLDRTAGIGKVIGWAPQVDVLAHSAIGGFVSHCGWNSVLESVWFGVPIATWPMYAEQQANAFQLVKELGIGVEIKMDYNTDFIGPDEGMTVSADEIKRGITDLMDHADEVRKQVKEMSVMSRNAFMEGGTSFSSLDRFLYDVRDHI